MEHAKSTGVMVDEEGNHYMEHVTGNPCGCDEEVVVLKVLCYPTVPKMRSVMESMGIGLETH